MFRNLKLGVKLAGGCAAVLLIAVVRSLMDISSIGRLGARIHDMGGTTLPASQQIGVPMQEVATARVALRSLLIPFLGGDDRARQHSKMDSAMARYNTAWEAASIRQIASDHHQRVADVETLLLTGKTFEGGTGATACGLGQWMAEGKTGNSVIDEAVEALRLDHDRMHQGIAEVKADVAAGRTRNGVATLTQVVLPTRDGVLDQLSKIVGESERVVVALNLAFSYSMAEQKQANDLLVATLDELAAAQAAAAEKAMAEASADSGRARVVGITGLGLATALVVVLSVVLTLGITRPVLAGVNFAGEIPRGKLDLDLAIHQKDEVGVLAESLAQRRAALDGHPAAWYPIRAWGDSRVVKGGRL